VKIQTRTAGSNLADRGGHEKQGGGDEHLVDGATRKSDPGFELRQEKGVKSREQKKNKHGGEVLGLLRARFHCDFRRKNCSISITLAKHTKVPENNPFGNLNTIWG